MHERLERWASHCVAAFAALLPVHAIGDRAIRDHLPLNAADVALVVGAPLLVWLAWRRRRVLWEQRLVMAGVAMALLAALSELLRDGWGARIATAKHLFMAFALVAIASVTGAERERRLVVRAACVGGAVALLVSITGYAWACLLGTADGTFALVQPHPLFSGLCRMTGTFGDSPQHWGEYLVALLAFAAMAFGRGTRKRRWLMAAAGLALVATFSFAWIGGLLLAAGALRARKLRTGGQVAVGVAWLVAAWIVNIGLPAPDASPVTGDCRRIDAVHRLATVSTEGCTVLPAEVPYRRWTTQYEFSKETALVAFRSSPLLGVGHEEFDEFAAGYFRNRFDARGGTFYTSPHGTYAGALAKNGLFGLVGLVLLLATVAWARPWRRSTSWWAWMAVVAFLLLAINIDVERQRHLWLLIALVGPYAKRSGAGAEGGEEFEVRIRHAEADEVVEDVGDAPAGGGRG